MESAEEVDDRADEEPEETEFKVIPVQLVETYEGVSLASHSNTSNITLVKGKYYKQTYRTAWEQMPDFKGWLRGVEGEPTRAYCTYCHKTLHAHRLSLLKHTCTIRHQKAAQIHTSRKNKTMLSLDQKKDVEDEDDQSEFPKEDAMQDEEGQTVSCVESGELIFEDEDSEEERREEQNDTEIDVDRKIPQSLFKNNMGASYPVSTQVTDTSRGIPVGGLQVSLYKLIDGRWTYINEGITGTNGRFSQFLERSDFTAGRYKLHYDVDRYFESRKQATLFPFIEIIFDAKAVSDTYHIPLLFSPFGYSIYKGC